jgi:hypothetical protein
MVYVLFGSMIFEFWHPLLRLPPKATKIVNIRTNPSLASVYDKSCWGRASRYAPAYPRGKQQMLPGYSKSVICSAHIRRGFIQHQEWAMTHLLLIRWGL